MLKFFVYDTLPEILNQLNAIFVQEEPDGIRYVWDGLNFVLPNSSHRLLGSFLQNRYFPRGYLPEECDYFIVPIEINIKELAAIQDDKNAEYYRFQEHFGRLIDEILQRLQYYDALPSQHVFFLTGDSSDVVPILHNSVVFRYACRLNTHYHGLPYIVNADLSAHTKTIDEVEFDVYYGGTADYSWLTAAASRNNIRLSNVNIVNSKFVLCPKTVNLSSPFIYEAMAFGRIPIIVSDYLKLPIQHVVPYADFSIRISEDELVLLDQYLDRFKITHKITEASKIAQGYWYTYFAYGSMLNFLEKSLTEHSGWFS